MEKKTFARVLRRGKLADEVSARDRDLRRKIAAEFPPAALSAIPRPLSSALKGAIRASDMSVYRIATQAHVSQIVISRFLSGERDIRMATADRIAGVLGLTLRAVS
jgi:hypothetical protein